MLKGDINTLDLHVIKNVPSPAKEYAENIKSKVNKVVKDSLASNSARAYR